VAARLAARLVAAAVEAVARREGVGALEAVCLVLGGLVLSGGGAGHGLPGGEGEQARLGEELHGEDINFTVITLAMKICMAMV